MNKKKTQLKLNYKSDEKKNHKSHNILKVPLHALKKEILLSQ